mgnify:CR=1 FL=1
MEELAEVVGGERPFCSVEGFARLLAPGVCLGGFVGGVAEEESCLIGDFSVSGSGARSAGGGEMSRGVVTTSSGRLSGGSSDRESDGVVVVLELSAGFAEDRALPPGAVGRRARAWFSPGLVGVDVTP